jgi:hypothetical protein
MKYNQKLIYKLITNCITVEPFEKLVVHLNQSWSMYMYVARIYTVMSLNTLFLETFDLFYLSKIDSYILINHCFKHISLIKFVLTCTISALNRFRIAIHYHNIVSKHKFTFVQNSHHWSLEMTFPTHSQHVLASSNNQFPS